MRKDSQLNKTLKSLEKLDKEFLIENVSDKNNGKDGHWSHNNKIKLWSVGRATGEFLKVITQLKKPKVILELGTSAGYSTIWIASALKQNRGKIFTIEMSSFKVEIARESFKKAGLSGLITQIEGDILKVLSTWNTKIDMVFIDADKYDYLKYIKKLESSLNNGAVIVADNMTNFANEVKNYVKYMNRGSKYVSQFVGIEDGLLLSIYKNN